MENYEIRAHVAVFLVLVAFYVAAPAQDPGFSVFQPLFILVTVIGYTFVLLGSVFHYFSQNTWLR